MGATRKRRPDDKTLTAMWDMLTAAKLLARSGQHDFLTYLVEMAETECAEQARKTVAKDNMS